MSTPSLALHVAKRYLDHTQSLLKSTKDAIAEVPGFEPCVGDLTVSENNINAAVTSLDTFRVTINDLEKVRLYLCVLSRLTWLLEYVLCYDRMKSVLNSIQKRWKDSHKRMVEMLQMQ